MRHFVESVLEGAAALAALYLVGIVSYQAGRAMGREEERYSELKRNNESQENQSDLVSEIPTDEASSTPVVPDHSKRLSFTSIIPFLFKNRHKSIIRDVVQNPEAHKLEAFISDDELHVLVKPKVDG